MTKETNAHGSLHMTARWTIAEVMQRSETNALTGPGLQLSRHTLKFGRFNFYSFFSNFLCLLYRKLCEASLRFCVENFRLMVC